MLGILLMFIATLIAIFTTLEYFPIVLCIIGGILFVLSERKHKP